MFTAGSMDGIVQTNVRRKRGKTMAKIEVTPIDSDGGRRILVDGIAIPDVTDVSMYVRPGSVDEVTFTVRADSFQSVQLEMNKP